MMTVKSYRKLSLFLLVYALLVILWGAWVRLSGSGNGCGDDWPLCRHHFVPVTHHIPTWIEFIHRATSGFFGIAVLAMVIITFKVYPKRHFMRKLSLLTLLFTITEALIGARLVLAGLVGQNASVARAYTMDLHMLSSLMLTGCLALSFDTAKFTKKIRVSAPKWLKVLIPIMIVGFLVIAMMGAIAALSGTLFPSETLLGGLQADFSKHSQFLVRLRIWHPILATVIGATLAAIAYLALTSTNVAAVTATRAKHFLLVVIVAICFGYATLFLLSPVWMQITHLCLAHLVWIFLLFFIRSSLFVSEEELADARRSRVLSEEPA